MIDDPRTVKDLADALKWADRQLRALVTEDEGSGSFIRGTGTELAGFSVGRDQLRDAIKHADQLVAALGDPPGGRKPAAFRLMRDGVLTDCTAVEFDTWLLDCAESCGARSDADASIINLAAAAFGQLLAGDPPGPDEATANLNANILDMQREIDEGKEELHRAVHGFRDQIRLYTEMRADRDEWQAKVQALEHQRDLNVALGLELGQLLGRDYDGVNLRDVARELIAAKAKVQALEREVAGLRLSWESRGRIADSAVAERDTANARADELEREVARLKGVYMARQDDDTKQASDECEQCGSLVMCDYHSLLSELAGRVG